MPHHKNVLQVGDVIEVVGNFDCLTGPGDRAIHTGLRRWLFHTRVPSGWALPLYDARTVLDGENNPFRIVGHLGRIPESLTHPILRPERREHFMDSVDSFTPRAAGLLDLDFRTTKARKTLDDLVVDIYREEPDLHIDDLSCHFFGDRGWDRGYQIVGASAQRLEREGRLMPHPSLAARFRVA